MYFKLFNLGVKYIHILSGNEEKLNDIYSYIKCRILNKPKGEILY